MRKFRLFVSIAVQFVIGAAMAILAASQLASLYATAQELERVEAQEQAVAACMEYDIPHALVLDGRIYCYTIFDGDEVIGSIEDIADYFRDSGG